MANGVANPDIVGAFLRGRAANQQNQLFQQQLMQQKQAMEQQQQTKQLSGQILGGKDVESNIQKLFQTNPDAAEKVLNSIGLIDQRKRDQAANFAFELKNTPAEARQQKIMSRIQMLKSQGRSSADTEELLKLPPEQQDQALTIVEQAAMTAKERVAAREKGIDFSIKKEGLELRRRESELRKAETEERVLDRKLARETNGLKRQEIQSKLEATRQKAAQGKRDIEFNAKSAIGSVDSSISTIDRLLTGSGLESAAGFQANFPTIAGTEASDFESTLETLKSQTFLSQVEKMKGLGALSENEGKKLAAAIGSLDVRKSDKALRAELKRIRDILGNTKSNMQKKFNFTPQSDLTGLSDADLLDF